MDGDGYEHANGNGGYYSGRGYMVLSIGYPDYAILESAHD